MRLEVLYPELSGLYGDAMNAELIIRAVPETEVIKTALKARPAFADGGADIVYLGSMSERAQEYCADALVRYRDELTAQIESGTVFLVTGNAAEIFGRYIEDEDGTRKEMVGIFEYYARRRMMERYNSLYLGRHGEKEVVGYASRFTHMYAVNAGTTNAVSEVGDCMEDALFSTLRGAGRAPGVTAEGFRRNNFMATYVLGPLLALNPPFFKYLLKLLGSEREIPFERAAYDAYEQRLREFRDPKTAETF